MSAIVQSKKKRKKSTPRLPMADVAHTCSLLAVDPATLLGWSLYDRGSLRSFGEGDVFGTLPGELIARLLAMPAPHVVVLERPFRAKFSSQTGLGVGERIMREFAARAGLARRTVRVYPSSWRSRVLPKGWARRGTERGERVDIKAIELREAQTVAVKHLGIFASREFDLGPESAPAILIGKWGCFAPEVLAKLPKPRASKRAKAA